MGERKIVCRVWVEDSNTPEVLIEFDDGDRIIYDWPAESWWSFLWFIRQPSADATRALQQLLDTE